MEVRLLSDSGRCLVRKNNYFFINMKWYVMGRFGSEDFAGSFFGSRDLVQDRLPIQKDRLVIMMSADSKMTLRHDSRMTIHDWNLKFHDMETWMASDRSGGGDDHRIAI